jgi:uncharacterized protein YacL
MTLMFFRVAFILVSAYIGRTVAGDDAPRVGAVAGSVAAGVLVFAEMWVGTKRVLSGFLVALIGLLAGMSLSLLLIKALKALEIGKDHADIVNVAVMWAVCYVTVSFLFRTKDDIKFLIPYLELEKRGPADRPIILDTNVIIDGRIADIAETRILDSEMFVPQFVLEELQAIADSSDKLKRARGRRGLDMLARLRRNEKLKISIRETEAGNGELVDLRLVKFAKTTGGRVMTNDYNLNKVAQLQGVEVININDLANALKPIVLPGEELEVKIVKPGEESGQGVGYLEYGTMVVVEHSREMMGKTVGVLVTSALQTSAGRMVFGKLK